MMKYTNAFQKRMPQKYEQYKEILKKGESKINTEGLFAYEIIKKSSLIMVMTNYMILCGKIKRYLTRM